MRQLAFRGGLMLMALFCVVSLPSAADDLPWTFKGKAADGYSNRSRSR